MNRTIEAPQRFNLHTHTYRCKHATGDVAEYTAAAVDAGADMLGFTEHPPLFDNDVWNDFRMEERDLDGYFSAIEQAKSDFSGIRILTGFEMDLYPMYKTYYEDTFLYRDEIDYLIGGVHWIKYRGDWMRIRQAGSAGHLREYFKEILSLMESGLMSFITHPDSFAYGYLEWDANAEACSRDILSAAEEYRVPLEINGCGIRKPNINTPSGSRKGYPLQEFWALAAEYDISVVCNSDAHKPEDTMASLDDCLEIAKRYNLKLHPIQDELLTLSSAGTALNL